MNRIELRHTRDGWAACYYGPHARQIEDLFGTSIIPTAFMAEAEPADVLADIQRRNPSVSVSLEA